MPTVPDPLGAAGTDRGATRDVAGGVPPEAPEGAGRGPVPVVARLLVWLVALPAGLMAAAVSLRALGLLDADDVIDAFTESRLSRFAVLLVLVPLWAGISAMLAHLVLEWAARRRGGKRQPAGSPPPGSL